MRVITALISSLVILLSISTYGQIDYYSSIQIDSIPINFDNYYKLSQPTIKKGSEVITLKDKILSKEDYTISYSGAFVKLSSELPYSIFDTLVITYKFIDLALEKEYKKHELVIKVDEKTKDSIRVSSSTTNAFTSESIFGKGIEKSGTLIRGFTIGTNRDFSLQSGLRLQLAGNLSDDIEIVAALTDENTPIQPEGNTERLDELDKVFIQVKHPNAIGTFGDYQLQKRTGEFGFIDRKLQGLMGEFNYKNNSAYVSVAGSKGKFNTNQFIGQEGVQGPYRLTGANNEREIIIIAGSERVYIDGVEMRRGENNDYVIDYTSAQVTFTPKKLITSASRVNIDFEYTDRFFQRNLFGTGVNTSFFDSTVGLKVQYLREGDDQDSPIDITLSDADKNALANAGDVRNNAMRSGVTIGPLDSLGRNRGIYQKVDTLINGALFNYYVYNPGDSAAIYLVNFSYVGEGKGDYLKESLGNYRFVGIGQGGYLPVVFLPLPELKQLGNIELQVKPIDDLSISLEYAGSIWDRNRLSTKDDEDNFGSARNIFVKLNPKEITINNNNYGKVGLSYKDRFIEERFTSPDRFNVVEFNREYNIQTQENASEQLREVGLTYLPIDKINLTSTYGFLKKGSFKSKRVNNTVSLGLDKYIASYNLDYVETKNLIQKSYWLRQRGNTSYSFLIFKPGIDFIAEDKKDKNFTNDLLNSGSLRYFQFDPFLEIINIKGLEASARYSFREDDLPIAGILSKESNSFTQFYELQYNGLKEVNSSVNVTLRSKKYSEEFKNKGLLDNETILIRTINKFSLWQPLQGDLFYEVSTQRASRLERVFLKVERGTGNYRYIGDINNNNIADENEFEATMFEGEYVLLNLPTDELFPVIDLKASTKWKLTLKDIFKSKGLTSTLLNPFSLETYWRIEENSTEPDYKKIYLFNFSSFQNEKTTIRGNNYLQQDLFMFENDQELSIRFRFAQRRSLNQYAGGLERGYFRERSIRIKFQMVEEINNQTDLINTTDNVIAAAVSNRKRLIKGNSIITDFSYRPYRNIEVGFKVLAARNEDLFPVKPTVIDQNAQTIRLNISFAGTGRIRIEAERNELNANTTENYIPFELTNSNLPGKNYYLRFNFDYRFSTNLQSTASYDGRSQGGKFIHNLRAEVRAFF